MTQDIESIGLSMDTSGVEKGIKSLETLAATGPKVEKSMGGVEGAATRVNKSLATLGQGNAANGLSTVARASDTAATSVKKVGDAAAKSAREIGSIDSAAGGAGSSLAGLSTAAGLAARAVAAIGITASVGEFVRMADASTNVASRLGLVTSSAAELASVQQRLFSIAQSSRVSFVDLVGTYAQVARSTKDLGVSQTALLGVIQTISQAVTISGGSAASAQAALVQLSQGFASGALRGEELNSVMEQTPRLAQAIAEGLGVSIGKLREMGQAGELTAEKVLGALEKSAASVAAEFGKMAVTVEQASTNAANSVLRLVGAFDRLLGVTSAIGGAIQSISNAVDFLSSDVDKLGNQGPLRDAAREVINLDAAAKRLRTGMQSGVLGPNAQGELDRINARLAEAKQRFRELDQQLSGVRDPRDQSGFTGRGASYANEAARQAKLREDANAFRLNQSGVPASYLKDMAELIRLNQAGVIVGKEYTDALAKQQDLLLKKTTTVRGSVAAANAEQNAYESLISSINAKIEADKLEMAGGSALTESQRIRIKLDQDLAAGRVKLTAQNERAVRLALEELAASEASALAAKTLTKANLDAAASREKYLTSLAAGLDKIQADIAAQIEATERMGLSKEAIAELDAAKLEMLATDLELQAIKAMDRNLDQQTYDALKKQAAAYRELGIAKKGGAAKEAALEMEKANAEAAKKAQEDWERASEQINSSLTDALLRGFESGKDFAKNLRDTVVNMFKTMVLRPVISAVVNPVAGALTGALGFAGTASAATGAASGGSGIGSIVSAGSSIYSALTTGVSNSITSAFSKFATSSVGTSLGLSTPAVVGNNPSAYVAPQLSSAGSAIGTGLGMLGSGLAGYGLSSMISGGYTTGGNTVNVLSGIASAFFGPLAGVAGGLINRAFGRKLKDVGIEGTLGGAEGFEGQQYQFYKGGWFRSDKTKYQDLDPTTASGLAQSFKAIQGQVGAFATVLGLETDRIAGFTTQLKVSTKGLDDAGIAQAFQEALATGSNELAQQVLGTLTTTTREVTETLAGGMGDWGDGTMQAVTRTIEETTYAASEYAREGEKAIDTLTRLATSLSGVNTIWDQLGNTLLDASLAGADAASRIADAFGGLEAMAQATGAYFQNFYSAEEQRAAVERQLNEALGKLNLQLPDIDATDARAQYRALAEAQDRNTEAGREAYVTLLQLSGAFASVTQAAGQAMDAAGFDRKDRLAAQRAQEKAQAEALQKQIEAYSEGAEQFNTLRDSLLKAGDAAGLLAAVTERAFADPSGTAPRWGANSTAASFNYEYGLQQAAMRQSLSNELSASALRVQNIGGALGGLSVSGMMGQDDPVVRAVYIGMRDAIVQAAGDAGFAVRDAVDGAALYAAQAQVRGQFSATGPGLASVYAAREAYGLASSNTDVKIYEDAQRKLNGALSSGAIGADQFARALQALNDTLPQAAALSGDFDAQAARAAAALDELAQTGLRSIGYYFGQLNTMALELAKMDEPINATIASIGRLNSFETAFGVSADAAGATGLSSLQIDRAQIIAEAAGIASAAMTTADAAAAAAKLAQSPAFAELGAKGIRDAALLLDGVGQYNAEGFERAFIRISDALAKGSVTEGQYKALFDTALDMFQGVPEETRTLIDSMTRLRDAMSGFADGLLIDEQRTTLSAGATLAEMQRQYAQAFAGASTGDNEAIGKYQQLANTLLDKELYSTQAEYNAAFGSVYGDARQLENIGVNTLANAKGDAMVSELKDMNAKLNKRVEDLEKNLMAALAQIAKNTSDTNKGVRQQTVIIEEQGA